MFLGLEWGVLFFVKHWPYFLALQGGAGLKKGISLPRSERESQSLIRRFTKSKGISWVLSSHLSTVLYSPMLYTPYNSPLLRAPQELPYITHSLIGFGNKLSSN
jgi:hypothetical protein